jgi:hypothetical protein
MKPTPVFINGKDYPVKYGFAALRIFTEATGTNLKGLQALGEEITMTQALALIWAGLKDGARVMNVEFNLSIDEVADLIDEDQEAMNRVLAVFQESLAPEKKGKRKTKKKTMKKQ